MSKIKIINQLKRLNQLKIINLFLPINKSKIDKIQEIENLIKSIMTSFL